MVKRKGYKMAIANKNEIEIFYKTHNLSIKEVASHFGISYRTLAHWVKTYGWVAGGAVESIVETNNPIVTKGINEVLDVAKVKIKNQIKQNLGSVVSEVDNIVLDNLLESSTDEILTKTMTLNYIQKNIALSAIIAKDRLMRMASTQDDPKLNPIIIACAEKVAKIFSDMQTSIYGKEISSKNTDEEIQNLSLDEINRLLNELE